MNLKTFHSIASQAATQKNMLTINYVDRFLNFSTRDTEPYEIKNGIYYGYTEDIGASGTTGIRKFRVSRIRDANISDKTYEPRWEVKLP